MDISGRNVHIPESYKIIRLIQEICNVLLHMWTFGSCKPPKPLIFSKIFLLGVFSSHKILQMCSNSLNIELSGLGRDNRTCVTLLNHQAIDFYDLTVWGSVSGLPYRTIVCLLTAQTHA